MDEYEEERVMTARRMAKKLARNRSKNRTVRKLPQSMVIVPRNAGRVFPVREAINTNKRLTYILLLGAVLCAYWYDIDVDTLASMLQVVSQEAHQHIPAVNLDVLGFPGLS
ncbi:MAG: hypothetical protein ABIW76_03370 [Fibrobacteria bacterium]